MRKSIRGALALVCVLAMLASFGAGSAAQPTQPNESAGLAVQTEQSQTAPSASYNIAVREVLRTNTVARPKADKASGTYTSSVKVKLTAAAESAKIYYTTDGSAPTGKSKEYTKTLTVKKNVTIKAVAIMNGKSSSVLTLEYKVRTAAPKVNKAAGKYSETVSVKLTSATSGVKIYYTTNGSTPTTKSTLYSKAIKVTKTTTIKAISVKSGMTTSKVTSAKYTFFKRTYTTQTGYLACTANEKKLYKAAYNGIVAFKEEIDLPVTISVSDAKKVLTRVHYDNPELLAWSASYSYYSKGKNMTSFFPEYEYSKSKQTAMLKELKTAASKIADKARKQKKVADQIKVIHDELILGAEYDDEASDALDRDVFMPNAFSAYGVLVDKIGVCESYSRAFQYVCQLLDIPVLLVCGDAGGGHMWNMVMIGDVWYHIDLTWDDPEDGKSKYIDYDYFLISTAKILKGRTIDPVAPKNYDDDGWYNFIPIPNAPKNYNRSTLYDAA